jgi:hypothetical protein
MQKRKGLRSRFRLIISRATICLLQSHKTNRLCSLPRAQVAVSSEHFPINAAEVGTRTKYLGTCTIPLPTSGNHSVIYQPWTSEEGGIDESFLVVVSSGLALVLAFQQRLDVEWLLDLLDSAQ